MSRVSDVLDPGLPAVERESYDSLSAEAQMAFLYALGHGATVTVACKYANASYVALVSQLDLGLSEHGGHSCIKFAMFFSLAYRDCLGHPARGHVSLQDLGRGTRFTHAEYIRQLRQRQRQDPFGMVPLDEFYFDD